MLAYTLNALERGEVDKNNLRSVSGKEYYTRHIHNSQQVRLRKFIKNASGNSRFTQNFIPLSEVEKPSMKNNVQKYMKRL